MQQSQEVRCRRTRGPDHRTKVLRHRRQTHRGLARGHLADRQVPDSHLRGRQLRRGWEEGCSCYPPPRCVSCG